MKLLNRMIPAGNPCIGWCFTGFRRVTSSSHPRVALALLFGLLATAGCSPQPQFRANNLEWVKQEKAARLEQGSHFDPVHHQDVADVMTAWFGTPDEPFFPYVAGEEEATIELVDPNLLLAAAGPVSSDRENKHAGLYREHCAHCHGISGDGAGPTASFLDPYPRDFRLGKYKFKSSPTGTPPNKDDLKRILVNGIPGTAMPSFRLLDDEELSALTEYVIYLSNRGTTERLLIASVRELGDDVPRMVSLPKAKRISDILREKAGQKTDTLEASDTKAVLTKAAADDDANDNSETNDEDSDESADDKGRQIQYPETVDVETVEEELGYLYEDYMLPVMGKWMDAMEFEAEIPDAPEWIDNPKHELYSSKIDLGQSLYFGQANCKQCHGETGLGDGQTNNYDDWTNDWLQVESLNPANVESLKDYLQAGAFMPRPIKPRNLRVGVYRGGDQPSDLYLRIKNGIEGTPMPASLTLNEDEVWALVAYVRQMPYETISRPATSKKTTNQKPLR